MLVRYEFEIAASAEYLFDLTQDYSLRAKWDPLTNEAFLVNSSIPAQGELVRCTAKNGLKMDTVYVSFKPNEVAAVKLVKGPYIFDKFAGGWTFKEIDKDKTLVKLKYNISTKPRCLSWRLTPIIVSQFKRETRKRIVALTDYAEKNYNSKPLDSGGPAQKRCTS